MRMLDREALRAKRCASTCATRSRWSRRSASARGRAPRAPAGRVRTRIVFGDASDPDGGRCTKCTRSSATSSADIGLLVFPELTLSRLSFQHFAARVRAAYEPPGSAPPATALRWPTFTRTPRPSSARPSCWCRSSGAPRPDAAADPLRALEAARGTVAGHALHGRERARRARARRRPARARDRSTSAPRARQPGDGAARSASSTCARVLDDILRDRDRELWPARPAAAAVVGRCPAHAPKM